MPPLIRLTLVVKRAPGPSTASDATAVATLVVDAGVASVPALSEYSTLPVAASATSTPSRDPTAAAGIVATITADKPDAEGRPAVPAAPVPAGTSTGVSTVPACTDGRAAATGTCSAASRGGSMRATLTPAASVNKFSVASVARAVIRVRRTYSPHPLTSSGWRFR